MLLLWRHGIWTTLRKQHGDLSFSSVVLVNTGVYGYCQRPLGGILSVHQTGCSKTRYYLSVALLPLD